MRARVKVETTFDGLTGRPMSHQYIPQVFRWSFVVMATWTFPLRVLWAAIMFIWNVLEFLGISNSKENWNIWARAPLWRNVIVDRYHHRQGDFFNQMPIYKAARPWEHIAIYKSSRKQAQEILDVYFEQYKAGLESDQIRKSLARKKKKFISYTPKQKTGKKHE